MSWIKTYDYNHATGKLKSVYQKLLGPNNVNIDNILKVHSLRPHSLVGHMNLYKNVLHNNNNTLPEWILETIGVYVSILNHCDYCVEHHYAGLKRLMNDDSKAAKIYQSLTNDNIDAYFESQWIEVLSYCKKLTLAPDKITENDIVTLREHGFDDGQILEINQVSSYFSYANRTVLGLGVNTKGDILGLSPNDSDDPDNWSHK